MANSLKDDESGTTILEFTVAIFVLFMVTLGLIDLGLLMFSWADANRVTLAGARCAATSAPVATGIDGPVQGTGKSGSVCGTAGSGCTQRPTYTCMASASGAKTGGTCTSSTGPTLNIDGDIFDALMNQMQKESFTRQLDRRQIKIVYAPLLQGYIGRPNTPMNITVSLKCTKQELLFVDALMGWLLPGFPAADQCGNLPDVNGISLSNPSTLPSEDMSGDCR